MIDYEAVVQELIDTTGSRCNFKSGDGGEAFDLLVLIQHLKDKYTIEESPNSDKRMKAFCSKCENVQYFKLGQHCCGCELGLLLDSDGNHECDYDSYLQTECIKHT